MDEARDRYIHTHRYGLVKRFVVTQLDADGIRVFAHSRQGQYTYATHAEAQDHIDSAHENNNHATLERFYGLPLEVRACMCWPVHFDPVHIVYEPQDK